MSWPTNPTNGQQVTIGNIVYQYNSSSLIWDRISASLSIPSGAANTVLLGAQPNITSTGTLVSLNVTGNVSSGSYLLGNIAFVTGLPTLYANSNVAAYLPTYSGLIGGTLSTAAQPNVTSLGTLTTVTHQANANITMSGSLSQLTGANLLSATYVTGTLTTQAQPNITSTGSLSSLTVTGDTTISGNLTVSGTTTTVNSTIVSINDLNLVLANNAANATAANGGGITINGANATMIYNSTSNAFVFSHLISANGYLLSSITGGNVTGQVGNALISGTVYSNAQPNITSIGTLASLSVTGLITATGGVKTGNIQDTGGTNTISVSSTTVGIVGSLNVGTGGSGNVSVSGNLTSTLLTGTLTTAAQPNITSVGTLTSVTHAANANITMSGSLSQITGVNTVSTNFLTVNNNATVTGGWLSTAQSTEVINALGALSTTTVTCNLSTGSTFYSSSVTSGANWTINFTNVPTTDARSIIVTHFVQQGATPYIPSAVQIDGVSQTLKWQYATTPTGTASQLDFFTFVLVRTGGAWLSVLGSYTTYG